MHDLPQAALSHACQGSRVLRVRVAPPTPRLAHALTGCCFDRDDALGGPVREPDAGVGVDLRLELRVAVRDRLVLGLLSVRRRCAFRSRTSVGLLR